MPNPGNRAANPLAIRLLTARLKAATQRLRNRINKDGTYKDCQKQDDRSGDRHVQLPFINDDFVAFP
jgi:hypothetical protein